MLMNRAQAPQRLHNLFFAFLPPAEVSARILGQLSDYGVGLDTMRRDRLHITILSLVCYGAIPAGLIEQAAEAAANVRAEPVPVKFERLIAAEKSAFLAPGESLDALRMFREKLGFTLMRDGVDLKLVGRFSPHVTVAYDPAQHFNEELPESVIWTADEFVLVDSHVGETRHDIVGRWRLGG
jgi:RNA 2',3'-cyclic 3'-phosphodiesterase